MSQDKLSLLAQARVIEKSLQRARMTMDLDALEPSVVRLINEMAGAMVDSRLSVRDYESARGKEERDRYRDESNTYLGVVRERMLAASQYDLFSAIEIAHFSALLDQLIEELQ